MAATALAATATECRWAAGPVTRDGQVRLDVNRVTAQQESTGFLIIFTQET
jgi:hypothetical protein